MSLFARRPAPEVKSIRGVVLRAGTTKDPSNYPSQLSVLLINDTGKVFTMCSWRASLEVSGTARGDQVTITYTQEGDHICVKSFVNHTYRDELGFTGNPVEFN